MGVCENIGIKEFPKQGDFKDKAVSVCFNYDTKKRIKGNVVRDDIEAPHLTIIKLSDGRYVLATECHYTTLLNGIGIDQ